MTETDDLPGADRATARAEAAALFAAAARSDAAGPGAVLHCLDAVRALQAATGPVPATLRTTDPDRLIEQALHILGSLPTEDFAHPQVRTAARHGRRALTEPR